MKFLHTMIRVSNLEQSLDFFINKLGFVEQRRYENEKGRYTLVFVAAALLLKQLSDLRPAVPIGALPAGTGRKFYIAGLSYLLLGIFVGTGLWAGWPQPCPDGGSGRRPCRRRWSSSSCSMARPRPTPSTRRPTCTPS